MMGVTFVERLIQLSTWNMPRKNILSHSSSIYLTLCSSAPLKMPGLLS